MAEVLPHIARYAEQLRATRIDRVLGPATLSVGRIDGGTSVNTVPDRCQIEIDRRLVPGEDGEPAVADLVAYLRGRLPSQVHFGCSEPWLSSPALSPDLSDDLTARLGRATDAVRGSHQVVGVPYGTDASKLAHAGVPSVVFGPGDIARAHTCDEWVPLDEVEQASEVLYLLAMSA
jgi:acetylornithine deacetylase